MTSLLTKLDTANGCTNLHPTKPGWYIRESNKDWDWGECNSVEKIRADFVNGKLMVVEAYEMGLDNPRNEGGRLVEVPVGEQLPEPVWDADSQFQMCCLFKPCERDTPIPEVLEGVPLTRFAHSCPKCGGVAVRYRLRDSKDLIVCSDEKCPTHLGVMAL